MSETVRPLLRRSVAVPPSEAPMLYVASDIADLAVYAPSCAHDAPSLAARAVAALREDVGARLVRSRARLHEAVRRVPLAAWAARAVDDRWTASEILEHLALTEWTVVEFVRGTLLSLPARERPVGVRDDEQVLRAAADRSVRMEAPERLLPIGRWSRPAALCASVDAARDATLALAGASAELRRRVAPHPQLGLLDGAQWLLFLAGHTERHAAQLDELAAGWRAAHAAA